MCQLWAAEGGRPNIQVRLAFPYTSLDNTKQLDPITVAGLPGRRYVFEDVADPTFCSIEIDLRAYASLAIDAFDDEDHAPTGIDNNANCAFAADVADILVRRYVPLAGGTPWPDTPQRPDDAVLRDLKPCELVRDTLFAPIVDDHPDHEDTSLGTTCVYRSQHGSLQERIVNRIGGLDQFPRQLVESLPPGIPNPDALPPDRTNIKFGDQYPSREEHNDRSCLVAIETGTNQVLAVTYTSTHSREDICAIARLKMADGLMDRMHP